MLRMVAVTVVVNVSHGSRSPWCIVGEVIARRPPRGNHMRSRHLAHVVGLVATVAVAGCGDNIRPESVIEVHTRVAKTRVMAGERVDVRCDLLDGDGEPVLDEQGNPLASSVDFTITFQHTSSFVFDDEGNAIAARAGQALVRCAAPRMGLTDLAPPELEILPGSPARVITQLASSTTYAGAPVSATCLAFDAFDNPVPELTYTLAASPTGPGVQVGTGTVTADAAGEYEVSCVVMGAAHVEPARLLVLPALPASVVMSLNPERTLYTIAQQVTVLTEARDAFGNRVDDATFAYTATPAIPSPSEARFTFDADGTFVLSSSVTSATHNDVPLSASRSVVVNSSGPAIECRRVDTPNVAAEAYMVQMGPSTVAVPVRVSDTFAVQSVTINGAPATFDAASGNYTAAVPIEFGMNFVDVVARDEHGLENSTTCFILAASYYAPENDLMNGAVALRLDPRAISDSQPTGLDSLNDILFTVLNSPQLRTLVNDGLVSSNPIHNGSCGVFACEPRVNYNAGSINWNTPSSSLSLIANGLRAQVTLPNVRLGLNACGTTCCIGGTNLTVTASSISATVDFRLQLQGGVLRASVQGSPNVVVGSVSLNGSGFCGFIVNLVQSFFTDTVRNAVRDALTSFIASDVAPMLDQVVSSLDVNTLAQSFSVPRLDGSGTVDLGFGLAFSHLDITTSRALIGLGTRFAPGTVAHNRPSSGIPARLPSALLDPPGASTSRPVGISVYEGLLNHVLHGLWRGGYFQADLQLGAGTASIDARLPAVAAITSASQAQLMLGGIQATITLPGIINQPLQVMFGGRASASVSLSGNELSFGNLALTDLFVSFQASLTQAQRNALEDFLGNILRDVLADALNDGLPAVPIPSFTLPASVGTYGLPAGAELGIVAPELSASGSHYVLRGSFGVRN
jgi:hypothetical protein